MHFIKYFTILVLLAVQYSFQDDTTTFATTPSCTYNCDFGTTQEEPTDYVYRKKRSSIKEKLMEVKNGAKKALDKTKDLAKKVAEKTEKVAKKVAEKSEKAAKKVAEETKLAFSKLH